MNTILTRLSAELIEQYEAEGFWRGDTIYALVRWHAEHTPQAFAVRDRFRRLTYRELLAAADALAADLARHGVRAGQRVGVWLPSRIESVVALLACSKSGAICCPSLHRDHTTGDVVELMQRTRAVAFIWQDGYGADADKRDLIEALKAVPSAAACLSAEAADGDRQGAVRRDLPPAPNSTGGQDRSQPDRLSGVHLRHHRQAEGRDALRQHAARQRAAARQGLEHRQHLGRLYAVAAQPQSRLRRAGDGAGDGRRARHPRPAARRRASPTASSKPARASWSACRRTPSTCSAEMQKRGLKGLGRLTGFRISGSAVPSEVVAGLIAQGIKPQSGYGMTENCSHQYTLPDDEPRLIIETSGKTLPGLRASHLQDRRSRHRSRARRGRPDRRPRRQPDARLFRRPDRHRGRLQQERLVHDRRSRLDRRAGLSAHRRPQQGHHHPRRPQHPSGADRGAGDAASGGAARRRGAGEGRAARREGLPRGGEPRRARA